MKYFTASGLFGAGRPIGIFDPNEVLQGLWPITLVHIALVRFLILLHALLSCNNIISAIEILNFDKYLFLFHMSLGYKTCGLIKTLKVKPSLGKKPEKEKECPLQKLYNKIEMQQS
jgi:hypothetical protein